MNSAKLTTLPTVLFATLSCATSVSLATSTFNPQTLRQTGSRLRLKRQKSCKSKIWNLSMIRVIKLCQDLKSQIAG